MDTKDLCARESFGFARRRHLPLPQQAQNILVKRRLFKDSNFTNLNVKELKVEVKF